MKLKVLLSITAGFAVAFIAGVCVAPSVFWSAPAAEKPLSVDIEAEIEDGTLVLYVTVRNLLGEPILFRTKPEESITIDYDMKFKNPDSVDIAGLGGSAWAVGSSDKFIALAGSGGRQDRWLAREYRFRVPVVKRDFSEIREAHVTLGWYSDFFETESGWKGYLDVKKKVVVVPGERCVVKLLHEEVEIDYMKIVPQAAEEVKAGVEPVRVTVTPKRRGSKLVAEVCVENTTTDVMLWQVEPHPVKVLGERDRAATPVLPLKFSPLADYEAGFQAVGWEVSSVWREELVLGCVTDCTKYDVTRDVRVQGRYYNATRRRWGVVSVRRTVVFNPPDYRGSVK